MSFLGFYCKIPDTIHPCNNTIIKCNTPTRTPYCKFDASSKLRLASRNIVIRLVSSDLLFGAVCLCVYALGPMCPSVYFLICYEARKPNVVYVFNFCVLINK